MKMRRDVVRFITTELVGDGKGIITILRISY
jgi:hypothetical protein